MEDADFLGFTKQTAMILEGLNAKDLIPEFKKRNIPTDALPQLSKNDLLVLGATEELAEKFRQQLKLKVTGIQSVEDTDQERIRNLMDILKSGRQQLYLIDTFLLYSIRKLMESSADYLIDRNKNETASQALIMAANSTLSDLAQLERNYKELSASIKKLLYSLKILRDPLNQKFELAEIIIWKSFGRDFQPYNSDIGPIMKSSRLIKNSSLAGIAVLASFIFSWKLYKMFP